MHWGLKRDMWNFLWAHNVYDARRCWTITALTLGSCKKAQQKDNDTELLAWNIRCALSGHDYCGFPHCVYWIMSALCMSREVTKQEAEAHVRTSKHSKYHVKLWKDRLVMKVGSFCFGWLRNDNAVFFIELLVHLFLKPLIGLKVHTRPSVTLPESLF